ncbi:thioesterase family protein [Rhodococcus sp. ARC_M6]|uniref:acyl-CoA thioesterase n=1 Tax=Rhodococcus sp. ARC_M6 TaxID=2928852 RepID=UPI001FB51120|nr:thioesterase family protein [Rhodococcus sp. ARC_M6]MCJ0905836.1 thioesterase family protein [Rhodococcus sp. ARC_M6]
MTTASIMIDRVVDWQDTDAAGHYHHSTVIRWVEAAEAALYEQLGCLHLFGVIPRIKYEVAYRDRLWHQDRVHIELTVSRIGTSSMTFDFLIDRDGTVAAAGALTVVHTDGAKGGSSPWPEKIRAGFATGGRQQPSLTHTTTTN